MFHKKRNCFMNKCMDMDMDRMKIVKTIAVGALIFTATKFLVREMMHD